VSARDNRDCEASSLRLNGDHKLVDLSRDRSAVIGARLPSLKSRFIRSISGMRNPPRDSSLPPDGLKFREAKSLLYDAMRLIVHETRRENENEAVLLYRE